MGRGRRGFWFVKGIIRLCLNLTILAGFGILVWHGYRLFTHAVSDVLAGSIFLIVGIVIWILLIRLVCSRRYRWVKPSFKLTTFSVIAILLILTFAGVKPMSAYKDGLVEKWRVVQAERAAEREAAQAEEARTVVEEVVWTEFDEVTDRLSSPALLVAYMRDNFAYDWGKYQRWMTGDYRWDTPEDVFRKKMSDCGGHAIFALYCLLKNGYEYDDFDKHKDNAAVILGCWNSAVPNYHDTHTVLLYTERGAFYTIDVASKRGPFGTVEEAATASLSSWTACYFYDTRPRITRTVERATIPKIESKAQQLLGLEEETFGLINLERKKAGLRPIEWSDSLHDGARGWSENMQAKGDLYHDVAGVHAEYFAECIYGASWSRYRTPEQIVDAWMSSSGHRAILMGSYRIGAIGIAKDEGFFTTYRCKR